METGLRASMPPILARPIIRRSSEAGNSPRTRSTTHPVSARRRRIHPPYPRQESGRRQRRGTPPPAAARRKRLPPPYPRQESGRRQRRGTPPAALRKCDISESGAIHKESTTKLESGNREPTELLHISAHGHVTEFFSVEENRRALPHVARFLNIDGFDHLLFIELYFPHRKRLERQIHDDELRFGRRRAPCIRPIAVNDERHQPAERWIPRSE